MLNLNHIKDIYFFRYNIVFTTSTYVIPMILMGFCYTKMGRHLWGTPIIGEETPQLLKNYESKKKVRIIITVSEVRNSYTCVIERKCLLTVVNGSEAFLLRRVILILLGNATKKYTFSATKRGSMTSRINKNMP